MNALAGYVARTASEPFVWGRTDCATWAAGAVQHVAGIDPMWDMRGLYWSRFTAHRALMPFGGLASLVRARMRRFDPIDGDGVALVRDGQSWACAIVLDGRVLLKADRGLRAADMSAELEGWTLCPKP